jgi:hypothetical protein
VAQKNRRHSQPQPTPSEKLRAVSTRWSNRWGAVIRWCEFGLCAAMTAYLIACHFVFLEHRGGLWRDEVQIVNLGLSPTFTDFWKDLAIDTFPALWPAVVKCWSLVAGSSDASLKFLGLVVGLSIVAAAWWAAWQVGRGFPLFTLALFALCPTVIRYGDTLRGYGLGLIFLFLMYAQIWKAVVEPTWRHIIFGLITALLAVHSMYFNAVILLALGAASAAISLRRRSWKPVLIVVGIGILAAISLLPYTDPLSRQKQWHDIIGYDVSFSWIMGKVVASMNAAGGFAAWVWLCLTILALALVIYTAVQFARGRGNAAYDAGIFAGATIATGIAAYWAFIFSTRQPTNIWYYMPLMAFLSLGFDAVLEGSVLANPVGRIARLAGVAALFALTVSAAWSSAHMRMTNVDLIAQTLEKTADKDDLILVASWWPGVSFNRSYHGAAPWTTVPDLGPLRVQSYDVFKQRMGEKEPMRPVRDRIVATLRGGHRVWLVNWPIVNWPMTTWPTLNLDLLQRQLPSEPPSPPPLPAGKMEENFYLGPWFLQAAYDILHNAVHAELVPVESSDPVSDMENPVLVRFDGRQ